MVRRLLSLLFIIAVKVCCLSDFALRVDKLREMGIISGMKLLDEKAERSEFSDAKDSGASRRSSIWRFWRS